VASLEGYPAKAISVRLLRAREAVMAHVRPHLRAHGITDQQYRVLRALQHEAPLDNATIAERAMLLPPSVSRMLAGLQESGLVEDVRDNGRWVRARLTAKGLSAVEAAARDVNKVGALLAARLGAPRMRELERLLMEVEDAMSGVDQA
jgi:homoprotocatechuate degradation regulator HpaR